MSQHISKTISLPQRTVSLQPFRQTLHQRTPFHLQVCAFSATPHLTARKGTPRRPNADHNKNRGVSAMRHTGLREPLSVSKYPLPKPVLDPDLRDKPAEDPNHGLWGFFNKERSRLSRPGDLAAFGRPWQMPELREKSWEDLHALWWKCAKERNWLATEKVERDRIKAFFGDGEAASRAATIETTQKHIKEVLAERYSAWNYARREAMEDATVDLSGDGPALRLLEQESEPGEENRDPNAPVVL